MELLREQIQNIVYQLPTYAMQRVRQDELCHVMASCLVRKPINYEKFMKSWKRCTTIRSRWEWHM